MPTVTSNDGTTIGYETHGSGPLLIMVAGALQHRAVDQDTPKIAALLADSFTVLIYDRRGRGDSGNTEPYAVAREIEDIAALLAANGDAKSFLFGLSSGAVLALEAAAALPDRISRVIAYEPPVNLDQSRDQAETELSEMERFKAQGDGTGALETFMRSVGASGDDVAGLMGSPAGPHFASAGTTLAHDYRIMLEATRGDMAAHWRGLRQPVLVVDGDKSWAFMASGADAVATALPHAQRLTLPDQGHDPAPEVIAPVIRDFFME